MQLVLLILAFVLFLLAAIGVRTDPPGRFNLIAAGLAAWVAAALIPLLLR